VQAAKAAYARAGYQRYEPPPQRRAPWSVDVDTSADLMFKQLYKA
jgi:hypothetical protein